jgi:predicted transcriptional regulator
LWIWRGRTKAAWSALGFDSEVFELFMRMKGGKTRTRVMISLSMPKDRLQLAQELGLDWKAVDHHIVLLCRYGFVHEQIAYGRVKMYELTSIGKLLLQLLREAQPYEIRSEAAITENRSRVPDGQR